MNNSNPALEEIDVANYYLYEENRLEPTLWLLMYSPAGQGSWDIDSYVIQAFESWWDARVAINKLQGYTETVTDSFFDDSIPF